MNQALYFADTWIMKERSKHNIFIAFRLAAELGCELTVVDPFDTYPSIWRDTMIHEMSFILKVPSRDKLDEFISRTGQRIGLTNWREITESDYTNTRTVEMGQYLADSIEYGVRCNENMKRKQLTNPIEELKFSSTFAQRMKERGINTVGDVYSYSGSYDFMEDYTTEYYSQLAKTGFNAVPTSLIPFDMSDILCRSVLSKYKHAIPNDIPNGRIPSCDEIRHAISSLQEYDTDFVFASGYCDALVEKDSLWGIIWRDEYQINIPIIYAATGKYPIVQVVVQKIANICGAMVMDSILGSFTELVLPE
jgi:hypothetical protein